MKLLPEPDAEGVSTPEAAWFDWESGDGDEQKMFVGVTLKRPIGPYPAGSRFGTVILDFLTSTSARMRTKSR